MGSLQLWAGPECAVNRVGDAYRDQLEETGFAQRLDDLDRIAGVGIQRIRLPLLCERSGLGSGAGFDWRWADARIDRMQSAGLHCIAGLVHHGSGPRGTQLLDPAFPDAFARCASAVAQRYPHLDAYTPVNEPMTSACFSALYGIWCSHHRSDAGFLRALLNQLLATRLAMREIRRVDQAAQLVQTDYLGFTHATPTLRYQSEFENARHWLAFDLLGAAGWLTSAWRGAQRVRAEGADIRAVTVWAAFGTMDWDSLLASETGVTDLSV